MLLSPVIIKVLASVAGGICAIIFLKAEDKFYNRQFETKDYVKMFVQGCCVGFITMLALDFITNFNASIPAVNIPTAVGPGLTAPPNIFAGGDPLSTLAGGVKTSLASPIPLAQSVSSAFQKFKFNNGTPNF